MNNEKPQYKNQDSAGGMNNFSLRDLFAHIVTFIQTRSVLQLSKVFDKLAFFCKTKPILVRLKLT